MNNPIDFFEKPSGYSDFLDKFTETDNISYNILNYDSPQTIFFYGVILVIFIWFSLRINFSYSLLIGLIFYSFLIYYLYTNSKVKYIDEYDKLNTKYTLINTPNNILKKYPNIIDFLFYMTEFKEISPILYLNIQTFFENFILLYEACLQDIKLINQNYLTLQILKNKILYTINSFTFNSLTNTTTVKLYNMRNIVENMLNTYLEELVLIQKKDIYYNGYNMKTQIINTDNILPHNYFDSQNQYVRNTKQYDVLNMFLL
jgi:hypothetical protein